MHQQSLFHSQKSHSDMNDNKIIIMASDDKQKHHGSLTFDQENGSQIVVDAAAERSYCQWP